MASIDLGRLVTESLNRFGGEAASDSMDLADVFQEAAAQSVKPGGKKDKFGTGFVAGKANMLEKGEQKVRQGASAAKGAIASGASKVAHGSIAGAYDSAKGGMKAAGSHIAAHKGKYAAGGVALAGLGALAYKYMKNRKKKAAAGK